MSSEDIILSLKITNENLIEENKQLKQLIEKYEKILKFYEDDFK